MCPKLQITWLFFIYVLYKEATEKNFDPYIF